MSSQVRAMVTVLLLSCASLSHAVEVIFFWGHDATPPIDTSDRDWVTPHPSYMSAAADARYGRDEPGSYGLVHRAIPGGDLFSAAVLMKPYGTDALCSLRQAYAAHCYDRNGRLTNTRFLYFWATAEEDEMDLMSYGRVDVHGGYPTFYQFGTYRPGRVTQLGTGFYVVELGEAASFGSSVQVQHFAPHGANTTCNPLWWHDGRVYVRCVHRSGRAVDAGFRLIAASGIRRHNHNVALFDVATSFSSGANPSLDPRFSRSADGSPQSMERLRTGFYRVRLGRSANVEGHVQVTSMDYNGAECHVLGWGSSYVRIACTRNGVAVDSPFTIMGATPLTGSIYPRP